MSTGPSYPRLVVHPLDPHGRAGGATRAVPWPRGATAYEALTRAGIDVTTTCRGSTICGLCHAEVLSARTAGGAAVAVPGALADEQELLDKRAPGRPHARLTCRLTRPHKAEVVELAARWAPPPPDAP